MKKLVAALIISVMMFASFANAAWEDEYADDLMLDELSPFSDVSESHQNRRAINHSYQFGIIEGYPDGTFGPDREINRAELTKIIVANSFEEGESPDSNTYKNCFDDVTTEWYAPYICYAYEQGWVQGYEDGTFKPGNPINRVEAMKIILEVGLPADQWPDPSVAEMSIPLPVDIVEGQWYEGYARLAIVKELVDGQHVTQDNAGNLYYYPGDPMTRKEVVEMLWRMSIWVVQRMSYAEATAELGCFIQANPDLETSSEQVKEAYVYQIYELYGFDSDEEIAEAQIRYDEDSVANSLMETYIIEKCGEGVEYDNWLRDEQGVG